MEIRLLLGALRRAIVVVVGLTLLGAVIGIGLALSSKVSYQATASVTVVPPNIPGGSTNTDPTQYAATQVAVIDGTTVLGAVANSLRMSSDQVGDAIKVAQVAGSYTIAVTATASDPELASRLADGVASTYISQLTAQVDQEIQAQISSLKTEINSLNATLVTATASQAGAIETQITSYSQTMASDLNSLHSATTGNAVVSDAVPTALPRHTSEKAGLGLGIGLAAGVLFSVLLSTLRPRMLRSRDVEQAIGVSAAAELPYVPEWRQLPPGTAALANNGLSDQPEFALEVAKIAVFVEAARSARNCKTVLVTSLESASGVSTISQALSASLREGSRRVRLVDMTSMVESSEESAPSEVTLFEAGRRSASGGDARWAGGPAARPTSYPGGMSRSADAFSRRGRRLLPISDDEFDADIMIIDGGSISHNASVVSVARSTDVTVLVVPLPNEDERYLHAVTRATFSDARGQLLIVTNTTTANSRRGGRG